MSEPRDFEERELAVIDRLMSFASSSEKGRFPDDFSAQDYVDNLPGSIHILRKSANESDRKFGVEVAAECFTDSDGALVRFGLAVDDSGYLYDLDIWKVNDEAIRTWPSVEEIEQCE